jgi:hypothetical protein
LRREYDEILGEVSRMVLADLKEARTRRMLEIQHQAKLRAITADHGLGTLRHVQEEDLQVGMVDKMTLLRTGMLRITVNI